MSLNKSISIIIPAFNEETRLPLFLNELADFARSHQELQEVIVVDDGSTDGMVAALEIFFNQFKSFQVISLKKNRGKGYAVRRGMLVATSDIVIFMDADGATGPSEILPACAYLDQGFDVVLGSRVLQDKDHQIKVRWYRRMIGRVFNFLARVFIKSEIRDTQCGFKVFTRKAAHEIFSRVRINRFGFDIEVIFLALRLEFQTKELSINWVHKDGSKVNFVFDSLQMLLNMFQVRWWHGRVKPFLQPHMSKEEIQIMSQQEDNYWWFKARRVWLKTLMTSLKVEGKALDAGCGAGGNLQVIKDFAEPYGCDISQTSLTFSHEKGFKNLSQASLEELKYADETFDAIVCLDVLEHTRDDRLALLELKRVLKQSGHLIIGLPAGYFLFTPHDVALSHFRRYALADLRILCDECDVEIERMGFAFSLSFLPVAVVKMLRRLCPEKGPSRADVDMLLPSCLDCFFYNLSKFEFSLFKNWTLPFGSTIFVVIKKRDIN